MLSGIFGSAANLCWQQFLCLQKYLFFVCFAALRPKPPTMVMARRSAHLTTPFLGKLEEAANQYFVIGAQWLSGRVFDSILSGRGFEPNRRHCVVPLSKRH